VLTRRYLTIPASFITIKRVFSVSNNVVTKSRNRLLPSTVKQIMLLKYWKITDLNGYNSLLEEEDLIE
jgi:hypothetical protein